MLEIQFVLFKGGFLWQRVEQRQLLVKLCDASFVRGDHRMTANVTLLLGSITIECIYLNLYTTPC